MLDEKFEFTGSAKKRLLIFFAIGLVLTFLGIFTTGSGEHESAEASQTKTEQVSEHQVKHVEATQEHQSQMAEPEVHENYSWKTRLISDIWINNLYFTGLALLAVFFVAVQYAAKAGWSASIKRVPESFGYWIPVGGVILLIMYFIGRHDLFHWTHSYLYDPNDSRFDAILDGKHAYLNEPFYLIRMVLFVAVWYIFFRLLRKRSLQEDLQGGTEFFQKQRKISILFIVFLAYSSVSAAWDWIMSIDPHWFSTMWGWYVFASWWITALAAITLVIVVLKENGYLKIVNQNHLHDLGKFVFAFSIFWTYIWFAQFLLIYYANLPEESTYFVSRWLASPIYKPLFYVNVIANFFFPFLVFMTRDSKRHTVFLKIVTIVVLSGHWVDFYLMVTPGVLKGHGGIGFMEIGTILVFGSAFLFMFLTNLSKVPLIAKNHPLLEEANHHHV